MPNNQPDRRTDKLAKSDAVWRAELAPRLGRPASALALSEYDRRFVFMRRPEVRCAPRDGYLGRVFPDRPRGTTGLRCCIKGVAPKFRPEDG